MTQIKDTNLRGIVFMVFSMAAFAVADACIKLAAGTMSPAHTILVLIAGGAIVFGTMAKAQGDTLVHRAAIAPIMLLRYVAEIVGTFGMVLALTYVPLSTLGAILQATPLLGVAGAVLFLGERVSWRRWSAILVGFVGVLMIIKPGAEGFELGILWAVFAMFGLTARDLSTRMIPRELTTSQVTAFTMLAILPVAVLWCVLSGGTLLPQNANWFLIFGMVGFGTLGYHLITVSVRLAEVSVVSPFRYSRLLFLLGLGVTIFGERPDALTLAGAALIIASGIYSMWRDKIVKSPKH
ncbi:MAG: DMT family transporter [Litoreibacter sp.]